MEKGTTMERTTKQIGNKKTEMLKDKVYRGLILALVLCLISMLGAGLLQTNFGTITLRDVRTVGVNGKILPGTLYVPETATAETPAPAIINIHGWWKTREAEQFLSLELARRGYVVFNIDMSGHGDNEIWDGEVARGDDVYSALKMLENISYVDATQIGVTGHSSGGSAIDAAFTTAQEAGDTSIISMLFVGKDPTYRDENGSFYNKYGSIDVGCIASQYDDWYYNDADETGEWRNAPRDYLTTDIAKSFVGFGDPKQIDGDVISGEYYTQEINGTTARRVIYNPVQIHSWNTLSPTVVREAVEYFQTTIPAPTPLAADNQIGFLRECFTGIGIFGFFLFVVYFCLALLRTPTFQSLRASEAVSPAPAPKGAARIWFWGGLIASAIFSFLIFRPVSDFFYVKLSETFPCELPAILGIWGALSAAFTGVVLWAGYRVSGKRNGQTLQNTGLILQKGILGKTILLSLIVITVAYSIVFLDNYLFKSDFRFWALGIRAFTADRLRLIAVYIIPFLIFYIVNSIAVNCFNYHRLAGKEWTNLAVLAIFNAMPCIIYIVIQYGAFLSTGYSMWHLTEAAQAIPGWSYSLIPILIIAPMISRRIYKETRNPYLGGLITGVIMAVICISNATVNI